MEPEDDYQEDNFQYDDDDMYIIDDPPAISNQESAFDSNRPFKVTPTSDILKSLSKNLEELNDFFCVGRDWALIFLANCGWSMDKCKDSFVNSQKKLFDQSSYNKNPYVIENTPGVCQVCLDSHDRFVRLSCGHSHCWGCWRDYVNAQVNSKLVFFTCMTEGCKAPVLRSLIEQLIKDTPSRLALYNKYLGEKYVEINLTIKFCPGVDCDKCIQSPNTFLKEVTCTCGTVFCFRCKEPVHRPCECGDTRAWKELVEKEQANAQWLSIHTKICPWCNKHVERSTGCNFMSCACGKSFCYVCSRPWEPDHKDHFKCNIYKPGDKEKETLEKEKSILQKLNFYCEKYLSNQYAAGKLKEISEKVQDMQQDMFNILGVEFIKTDFFKDVYHFAIEACNVLKWSYAFRYFMNEKSKFIDLFQGCQSDFERFKQNLLFKLETKLIKFIEGMRQDRKAKVPVAIDKEAKIAQFMKIREELLTFFKAAQTYMRTLITSIETQMT